jgi:signal peptidase II
VTGALRRFPLLAAVAVLVLAVDQLTKWWALVALDDGPIDLVWTLRLNLTFNTGSAFSIGAGRGGLIAVLAVVIVGAMVWLGRAVTSVAGAVALGAVLGGALGNLADRAFRAGDGGVLGGAVVDFVDLGWWPVFNVADAAIVVGGVALVLAATHER